MPADANTGFAAAIPSQDKLPQAIAKKKERQPTMACRRSAAASSAQVYGAPASMLSVPPHRRSRFWGGRAA
jgi:hypothetical protein